MSEFKEFEKFARWYGLPLNKGEDGIYRALETQSAWMSFQHQQAKVEDLQKRVDAVACELDCQIQCSISSHTQKMLIEIRQALKGGKND